MSALAGLSIILPTLEKKKERGNEILTDNTPSLNTPHSDAKERHNSKIVTQLLPIWGGGGSRSLLSDMFDGPYTLRACPYQTCKCKKKIAISCEDNSYFA